MLNMWMKRLLLICTVIRYSRVVYDTNAFEIRLMYVWHVCCHAWNKSGRKTSLAKERQRIISKRRSRICMDRRKFPWEYWITTKTRITYWSYRISNVFLFILIFIKLSDSHGIPYFTFVPKVGMNDTFDRIACHVRCREGQKTCNEMKYVKMSDFDQT